jgi:hypothetical protein
MKQAATIELFSYWDALRNGHGDEFRDAAPEQIRALLSGTFLIEVDSRKAYPLRVAGGTLSRLTSRARLGASFLECWDRDSRDLLEAMLRVVHDERLPVVIGARSCSERGEPTSVECLLLPLKAEPKGLPRILGGAATVGPLKRRSSPDAMAIVSARPIQPPFSPGLFARKAEFQISPPAPSMPPLRETAIHLRVIEGGRP